MRLSDETTEKTRHQSWTNSSRANSHKSHRSTWQKNEGNSDRGATTTSRGIYIHKPSSEKKGEKRTECFVARAVTCMWRSFLVSNIGGVCVLTLPTRSYGGRSTISQRNFELRRREGCVGAM
ncbi:hypothetical protein PISMIDRAFT_498164 [Pisolithus microcarpus 441]|uniref:Uncharacterized protein n=1 Tax=Pisolithus microcarpus 441 TaxID=765257 RepID=A0A0C9Z980_9AGAM|nr:hypothetical protein PISMIDRAFT_498164 [Pisolithus microcarpus 441]